MQENLGEDEAKCERMGRKDRSVLKHTQKETCPDLSQVKYIRFCAITIYQPIRRFKIHLIQCLDTFCKAQRRRDSRNVKSIAHSACLLPCSKLLQLEIFERFTLLRKAK